MNRELHTGEKEKESKVGWMCKEKKRREERAEMKVREQEKYRGSEEQWIGEMYKLQKKKKMKNNFLTAVEKDKIQ